MYGWNTTFLLGWPIFRCELLVSGRVFDGNTWNRSLDVEIPPEKHDTHNPRVVPEMFFLFWGTKISVNLQHVEKDI